MTASSAFSTRIEFTRPEPSRAAPASLFAKWISPILRRVRLWRATFNLRRRPVGYQRAVRAARWFSRNGASPACGARREALGPADPLLSLLEAVESELGAACLRKPEAPFCIGPADGADVPSDR